MSVSSHSNPDVIIIGGGVIGCMSAFLLAESGRRVTVVERDTCGRQASWAGAGIITSGSHARTDPLALIRRASVQLYPEIVQRLWDHSGIDPQYDVHGCLDLISDDSQDKAADREVLAAGDARMPNGKPVVERLSTDEVCALEPAVTRETRGALFLRDTAMVRNPRLMKSLVAACEQLGVVFRCGAAVSDLAMHGDRVIGVRTEHGEIHGGQTVLAAGAWSPQIDARLGSALQMFPVRGQIMLFDCRPKAPIGRVVHYGKNYLVPRRDGHLLAGASEEPKAGFDTSNTEIAINRLKALAVRFVPQLENAAVIRTWAGLRPGTRDGKPYIGTIPGLDGLIVATGHHRSGLTLAPITAQLVAELMTHGPARGTSMPIDAFAPGREVHRHPRQTAPI